MRPDAVADQHRHVAVALDPDGVVPRLSQPHLGPGPDVARRCRVQRVDQVREGGVAEPVLREVCVHPGQEVLVAHPGDELAQRGRALHVGDRVEVGGRGVDVGHVLGQRRDRVRRAAPVGDHRARLVGDLEADPGAGEPGRLLADPEAHVLREGLVEPDVLPPGLGDEVAEPHVRHLVGDHHRPDLPLDLGDPAAREELVAEGDAAGVLHRAPVELRARGPGRRCRTGTARRRARRSGRSTAR